MGHVFHAGSLGGGESLPKQKKYSTHIKWMLYFWPARRDDSAAALPCAARPRSIVASDFAAKNVPLARFLNAAHPLRLRIPPDEKTALTKSESCFFWPARRDSNPRPSESESAAISSFATGGYVSGAFSIIAHKGKRCKGALSFFSGFSAESAFPC